MRAIYRHLDLLNEAAVLHHRRGFSCRWFEHSTAGAHDAEGPALGARRAGRPGDLRPYFAGLPEGPRLVAFNQNAYLTFARLAPGGELSYRRFEVAMTVSGDSAEYLRFAFPRLDVAVVPNWIDSELFRSCGGGPRRRPAMMPRKRPEEADQILRLLGTRLDRWRSWRSTDGLRPSGATAPSTDEAVALADAATAMLAFLVIRLGDRRLRGPQAPREFGVASRGVEGNRSY